MKAIILAGGFAKRMWPLTRDMPKPLLPVGGRPVIEHVLDKLASLDDIKTVYITTNRRFEPNFREWLIGLEYNKEIKLVVEETRSDDEKLGSIGAMRHIVESEGIDDDLLCVAGDNIFQDSFDELVGFFRKQNTMVFGLWEMQQSNARSKFGIASLDSSGRVVDFEEKPENPKSNLVSTGLYIVPKAMLGLITEYLEGQNNPDTFGCFISWLYSKTPVHGHVFMNRWFDIGSLETYEKANEYMSNTVMSDR